MNKNVALTVAVFVLATCIAGVRSSIAFGQTTDSPPAIAKRIGAIKTLNGNSLTLGQTSGPDISVSVQPTARILRLAPGEKDLKNATPLHVTDLHVGDMVRVRGAGSADGSISALEVVVFTQAAVAAVGDQLKEDWLKRGANGLVESVDAPSGNVTLSIPGLAGKKSMVVHTTKDTVIHRYAPDSAKSEDAKPSSLASIQPGDQLRVRGNRNPDGTEINAEEIYAGVFPQYAGTVKSVDVSSGTLTVQNLATKKTVQIKISADSQLQKIPAEGAQRLAAFLKGMTTGGAAPANVSGSGRRPAVPANGQAPAPGGSTWSGGGGMRPNGPPDIQRLLSRIPPTSLAEMNLQKGDAVMILATEGTATSPETAIKLLSGVEPLLQAPASAQAMMLTPWNLGGGAAGGDAAQ